MGQRSVRLSGNERARTLVDSQGYPFPPPVPVWLTDDTAFVRGREYAPITTVDSQIPAGGLKFSFFLVRNPLINQRILRLVWASNVIDAGGAQIANADSYIAQIITDQPSAGFTGIVAGGTSRFHVLQDVGAKCTVEVGQATTFASATTTLMQVSFAYSTPTFTVQQQPFTNGRYPDFVLEAASGQAILLAQDPTVGTAGTVSEFQAQFYEVAAVNP